MEDEPLIAFDSEHVLGLAGYEVVATVDNLVDAERVIEEGLIDLVMTDFALRGDGDGRDVARAAGRKDIAVMFVTGRPEVDAEGLAIARLAKPHSDRALIAALETIDALLDGRRLRKLPAGFSLLGREPA